MSGYDITATFLLVLLVVGYVLHRRAQRNEHGRRAAMGRHPSARAQRQLVDGGYDPHQRNEWR